MRRLIATACPATLILAGAALASAVIAAEVAKQPPAGHSEAVTLWRSANIQNYDLRIDTLCIWCASGSVVVHVRNGMPKSVEGVRPKRILDDSEEEESRITVESLFDRIERTYAQHAEYLKVRYDKKIGYPRSIEVDVQRATADDELIQNFSLKVVDATDNPSLERP